MAFLACFVAALIMVARELRRNSEDNYSNPDDFPHKYASRVIWIPVLHLAVSWTVATIGTPVTLGAGLLILSALALVFLIGVLSPHRALDVASLEMAGDAPTTDAAQPEEPALSPERQRDILKAIRRYVEDEQAYLDSHLSLVGVSLNIGINSKYVSLVMKSHLGGFFAYVNNCRLSHAARLKVERPELSGFGSRTTYYKIKKELDP